MKNKYFKYILIPNIQWFLYGRIIDEFKSYYWLTILNKEAIYSDTLECTGVKYCRYCGKGKRIKNRIIQ